MEDFDQAIELDDGGGNWNDWWLIIPHIDLSSHNWSWVELRWWISGELWRD